jgi:outer membrane protein assembly factor BamB
MNALRLIVIAGWTALATGCGLFGGGTDNSEPPSPVPEFSPTLTIQQAWSVDTGADTRGYHVKLTPLVAKEKVIVVNPKGEIQAFQLESGALLWKQATGLPLSSGAGAGSGLVVAGSRGGEVVALSEDSGEERWRVKLSSEILAAPQIGGNVVVVRANDGNLVGLSADSGARLWSYNRAVPALSLRGSSAPVVVDDLVFAGFDNGRVAALELRSGKARWEEQVAQPRGRSQLERMVDVDADLRLRARTLYTVTYQGRIATYDFNQGGALQWNRELSSYAGFEIDDRALYLTDSSSHVWALDRFSGASLWKQTRLQARQVSAPAVNGRYVVVGDLEGEVFWLRSDDGQFAARFSTGSAVHAPLVTSGSIVLALNANGRLFALRQAGGAE